MNVSLLKYHFRKKRFSYVVIKKNFPMTFIEQIRSEHEENNLAD